MTADKLLITHHTVRGIELDATGSVSPGWFSRIFEDTRWRAFARDDYALRGVMDSGVARAGHFDYLAPVNMEIYKSAANHLNPDKYVKWGEALINPTFYEPMTDMLALDWYTPRLAWFVEVDSYAPMMQMFDLNNWKIQ